MHKGRLRRVVERVRAASERIRSVQLIAAALTLHLSLAMVIHLVGRFKLLPALVDANGTGLALALDAIGYRSDAISLVEVLTREGFLAWLRAPYQLHTKLYSLSFALFGPLFGYNSLSAEPINALLYLLVLALIFRLGREAFDRRVGLLAATLVALWPTFLLHTTQLLRDSLFIVAMLTFVLVCVLLLKRDYSWPAGLAIAALAGVASAVLWLSRFNLWPLVQLALVSCAALLLLRQFHERRILIGNVTGVALLFLLVLCIPSVVGAVQQPDYNLPPVLQSKPVPLNTTPPPGTPDWIVKQTPLWQRSPETIQFLRDAFITTYGDSTASIDVDVRFRSTGDIIRYLPRAAAIGFLAPFPEMWFARGTFVGSAGRLLSGIETFAIYLIEAMAVVGFWRGRSRREFAAWMMLLVAALGIIALSLVIINVGALYRMRYVFLMLVVVLGAEGIVQTSALLSQRRTKTGRKDEG
jgi:hypothetical protein